MFKKRLSGTRRRLAEANPTPSQAKDYMVEIDGREGVNARDMGDHLVQPKFIRARVASFSTPPLAWGTGA